jgi:hypothetical protein
MEGGPWDHQHVCALLVKARRSMSSRGGFVVVGGQRGHVEGARVTPALDNKMEPAGALKVLHWMHRYMSEDELRQFREYLRVKMKAGGPSLRTVVEAHPSWGTWRQFNRRRAQVCGRIAQDLNRRGVPWFDLDDDGLPVMQQAA